MGDQLPSESDIHVRIEFTLFFLKENKIKEKNLLGIYYKSYQSARHSLHN